MTQDAESVADQFEPLARLWKKTAEGLAAENETLKDAIRMMCTEMPAHWGELARAEGWGHVADLVQDIIEGAYD